MPSVQSSCPRDVIERSLGSPGLTGKRSITLILKQDGSPGIGVAGNVNSVLYTPPLWDTVMGIVWPKHSIVLPPGDLNASCLRAQKSVHSNPVLATVNAREAFRNSLEFLNSATTRLETPKLATKAALTKRTAKNNATPDLLFCRACVSVRMFKNLFFVEIPRLSDTLARSLARASAPPAST